MATVLIVDDNADVCRLLARLVRSCGHSADIATGGQEAIDYFTDKLPDMVILDVMMPRVDGLAVLNFIRSTPASALLPVIMFTAISEGEAREKAIQQGANGYWVKGSLDLAQFDKQLDSYLSRAG